MSYQNQTSADKMYFPKPPLEGTKALRFEKENIKDLLFSFLECLCYSSPYHIDLLCFKDSKDLIENYLTQESTQPKKLEIIVSFMNSIKSFLRTKDQNSLYVTLDFLKIYREFCPQSLAEGGLRNIIKDLFSIIHQGFLLAQHQGEILAEKNYVLGSYLEKSFYYFNDYKYKEDDKTDLFPLQISSPKNNFFRDLGSIFNFREENTQDSDGKFNLVNKKKWIQHLPNLLPVFLEWPQNAKNQGESDHFYQVQKEFYIDEFLLENKRKVKQASNVRNERLREKIQPIREEINKLENYGDSKSSPDKILQDVSDILQKFIKDHKYICDIPSLSPPISSLKLLNDLKNKAKQKRDSLYKEEENIYEGTDSYLIKELCKTKYTLSIVIMYDRSTEKFSTFRLNSQTNKWQKLENGFKQDISEDKFCYPHPNPKKLLVMYPVCLTYVKKEA